MTGQLRLTLPSHGMVQLILVAALMSKVSPLQLQGRLAGHVFEAGRKLIERSRSCQFKMTLIVE